MKILIFSVILIILIFLLTVRHENFTSKGLYDKNIITKIKKEFDNIKTEDIQENINPILKDMGLIEKQDLSLEETKIINDFINTFKHKPILVKPFKKKNSLIYCDLYLDISDFSKFYCIYINFVCKIQNGKLIFKTFNVNGLIPIGDLYMLDEVNLQNYGLYSPI